MKKSPLLAIFLIVLVDVMGLTIIIPLLPVYAETLGASAFMAGMLISVYGFCQLMAGPVLGQLSDRIGRKPVLMISQVGTLIGFIILATSHSLWQVFLSRIIDGLTAGNISVAQAHISDVTDAKGRAKGFGVIGVAFSIGFLIGPAVSGFLSRYGYRPPILAAVGLSALSIVATWLLLSPKKAAVAADAEGLSAPARVEGLRPARALIKSLFDPKLGPLLWQFLAFSFMFAMFISGFPLVAVRRYTTMDGRLFDVQHIGYIYALMGLIGIVVQGGFIGRLVERFGEKTLVILGFLGMTLGVGSLARVSSMPLLLASITALGIGSSVLRPSLTSLVSRSVSASEQGLAIGMTQTMMSISQILAPMVGGAVIQQGRLSLWALLAGALALTGGVLALSRRRG